MKDSEMTKRFIIEYVIIDNQAKPVEGFEGSEPIEFFSVAGVETADEAIAALQRCIAGLEYNIVKIHEKI